MTANPNRRESEITDLIARIRASKSMAMRDSLFEKIIEVWERPLQSAHSDKLTEQQNAALAKFEALTGVPVFGVPEFERGEIDAATLWMQNKAWLEGVWCEVQNICF